MYSVLNLIRFCLFITLTGSGCVGVFAGSVSDHINADVAIKQYQTGDQAQAIRLLLQLAYQGNVAAQFNLGVINYGRADQEIAKKEARFWFKRAAENGDVGAQYNLGLLMLEEAKPGATDLAVGWLERSAEGGGIMAQTNLGIMALWAAEFPIDPATGVGWLEVASNRGDMVAAQALEMWKLNAAPEDMLKKLYPLDASLRAEVIRGGNQVKRPDSLVYALPTSRQIPLLQLPQGYEVEIINKSNGWANVKLRSGLPGWVVTNDVIIAGNKATIKRLETGLYVGPEINPEVYKIGTVTKGEILSVLNTERGWIQVESPLRFTGWMRESDVEILVRSIAMDTTVREIATSEPVENVSPVRKFNGKLKNLLPGTNNSTATKQIDQEHIESGLLPPKTVSQATRPLLIAANTIVYSGNSTLTKPLGRTTMPRNGKVLRTANNMVKVSVDSALSGWVFGSLLASNGKAGTIKKDRVRIRLDPDTSRDNIIAVRNAGDQVKIIGKNNKWIQIELQGKPGWVESEAINK